jgi:hypothetical protein
MRPIPPLPLQIAFVFLLSVFAGPVPLDAQESGSVDQEIQLVKQQVLELNRDLFVLEEELLYPNDTRLSVFLSVDVGEFFSLDAVKLSVDGAVVASSLYTQRQLKALQRGGVQRLYMGNLKSGKHEVVAVFTGLGPKGREYKRGTELVFEKTTGPKNLELKIVDLTATQQPEFQVREW